MERAEMLILPQGAVLVRGVYVAEREAESVEKAEREAESVEEGEREAEKRRVTRSGEAGRS